ncbi:MAG TPA: hypothetical protein VG370_22060 [Chloroflexota bacterium]|nr:hypothetical protein [Chloroflexota bacterium]
MTNIKDIGERRGMKRGRISVAVLRLVVVAVLAVGAVTSPAYAGSNKAVQGNGTGSVTCTSGGPAVPAMINFSANLNKGTISGQFFIFGSVIKFGGVVSGNVSTTNYDISGIEFIAVCTGAATPTTYTIGKDCGQGVTINFAAANGETGTFVGNVACST